MGVISATNGTGLQFNNADGTYTFNDAVELAGGDAGIDIINGSDGTFTFANTTITSPTGTAFNLNGGTADVTFTGKITQGNDAAAVAIEDARHRHGHVQRVRDRRGRRHGHRRHGNRPDQRRRHLQLQRRRDAQRRRGRQHLRRFRAAPSPSTATRPSPPSAAPPSPSPAAPPRSLTAARSTAPSSAGRSKSPATPAESSPSVGEITGTGNGIYVHDNTGGTFQFNGLVDLNTGTNDAVTLADNSGATIGFANLDVETTSGDGFTATGGGIIRLTGSNNVIATTTGVGLNLNGVEISSTGAAFKSVSVDGAANGIVLANLTGTGTLSVGSAGSSVGDGGTIQNTTGHGISITNAAHVSLNNMLVTGAGGDGIHMEHTSGSFDVTVADSDVNDAAGQGIDLTASTAGSMRLTLNNNQISLQRRGEHRHDHGRRRRHREHHAQRQYGRQQQQPRGGPA